MLIPCSPWATRLQSARERVKQMSANATHVNIKIKYHISEVDSTPRCFKIRFTYVIKFLPLPISLESVYSSLVALGMYQVVVL